MNIFWTDFQISTNDGKFLTKYLGGLYIDSKFIIDESLGSDIWDYKDKKVWVCVGIDLGDNKKLFMLNKEMQTLSVMA